MKLYFFKDQVIGAITTAMSSSEVEFRQEDYDFIMAAVTQLEDPKQIVDDIWGEYCSNSDLMFGRDHTFFADLSYRELSELIEGYCTVPDNYYTTDVSTSGSGKYETVIVTVSEPAGEAVETVYIYPSSKRMVVFTEGNAPEEISWQNDFTASELLTYLAEKVKPRRIAGKIYTKYVVPALKGYRNHFEKASVSYKDSFSFPSRSLYEAQALLTLAVHDGFLREVENDPDKVWICQKNGKWEPIKKDSLIGTLMDEDERVELYTAIANAKAAKEFAVTNLYAIYGFDGKLATVTDKSDEADKALLIGNAVRVIESVPLEQASDFDIIEKTADSSLYRYCEVSIIEGNYDVSLWTPPLNIKGTTTYAECMDQMHSYASEAAEDPSATLDEALQEFFIFEGKSNVLVPKDKKAFKLTDEQAHKLLETRFSAPRIFVVVDSTIKDS